MTTNLFVYGSLMFPKILQAITKEKASLKPAILDGYKRIRANDPVFKVYSAIIIKDTSSFVEGKLITEISMKTLRLLDKFEGSGYKRIKVKVRLGKENIEAYAYLASVGHTPSFRGEWDPKVFEKKQLEQYITYYIESNQS